MSEAQVDRGVVFTLKVATDDDAPSVLAEFGKSMAATQDELDKRAVSSAKVRTARGVSIFEAGEEQKTAIFRKGLEARDRLARQYGGRFYEPQPQAPSAPRRPAGPPASVRDDYVNPPSLPARPDVPQEPAAQRSEAFEQPPIAPVERRRPPSPLDTYRPVEPPPRAIPPRQTPPEPIRPPAVESPVIRPRVEQPNAITPDVNEPQAVTPRVNRPDPVTPEVRQPPPIHPRVEQPSAIRPDVEEPKAVKIPAPDMSAVEAARQADVDSAIRSEQAKTRASESGATVRSAAETSAIQQSQADHQNAISSHVSAEKSWARESARIQRHAAAATEDYHATMRKLGQQYDAGKIDAEEYGRSAQKAHDKLTDAADRQAAAEERLAKKKEMV